MSLPQVHKMLAEFRLIPGLNNLFDKLIWRKYTSSNHVVHGQNENCDCSPVSSALLSNATITVNFLGILALGSYYHCNVININVNHSDSVLPLGNILQDPVSEAYPELQRPP